MVGTISSTNEALLEARLLKGGVRGMEEAIFVETKLKSARIKTCTVVEVAVETSEIAPSKTDMEIVIEEVVIVIVPKAVTEAGEVTIAVAVVTAEASRMAQRFHPV